jgi:hypothetical protein
MSKKVYGEEIMFSSHLLEWRKHFSEGRDVVDFDNRPGRLLISNSGENDRSLVSMTFGGIFGDEETLCKDGTQEPHYHTHTHTHTRL